MAQNIQMLENNQPQENITLEIASKWSHPTQIERILNGHYERGQALSGRGPTLVESKSKPDLEKFLSTGGEIVQINTLCPPSVTGGFLVVSGFDEIKNYYNLDLQNDQFLKNFDGPILGCFSNIPEPGLGRFGTRNNALGVQTLSEQRHAITIGNVLCENKIVAPQMAYIGGVIIRIQLNPYREIPEWIFARRPGQIPPFQNQKIEKTFDSIEEVKKNYDEIQSALLSGKVVGIVSHHGTRLELVTNPVS